MPYEIALRRYEDYLLGKCSFMLRGPALIEKESTYEGEGNEYLKEVREQKIADAKEEDALAIVRYAITSILGWEPQEAMTSLDASIMKQLKLDKIMTYVQYPKDLNKSKDYAWMVHKAFPDETIYDLNQQVLEMYSRLKQSEIKRFPKRVFEGPTGMEKLAILLNEFISTRIPASTIEDLYEFFGNSGRANEELKDAKLYYAYRDYYNTPLEYLHESLGESCDTFLYHHYQYMGVLEEMEKELNKK